MATQAEGERSASLLTELQGWWKKRGRRLLIPKGRSVGVPPPRVFLKKRLQAVENKGRRCKKESKEAAND
jgi:hypothetical protein